MKKQAALIGFPVIHSLSPLIHNHWLQRYGIDGEYTAISIMPENLSQWIDSLIGTGFSGFNVTLPHKTGIMAFCDTVSPLANDIGAVNMVTINPDGTLSGTNTDVHGFAENLREQQPDWSPAKNTAHKTALVLGAGGAARAAVYALLEMGVEQVTLCNRTRGRAEILAAEEFCQGRVNVLDWDLRNKGVYAAGLVVNTTSLGMAGAAPLEIDLSNAGCLVYDIVYRPQETLLLQQARHYGLPVITGAGMLLHQARPAFSGWFGVMPEIDAELLRLTAEAVLS